MARFAAIAAVSRSVLGLLEDACPREYFPAAQFRLYQTEDLEKPRDPMGEGISLYLYRVSFNTSRRSLPSRRDPSGKVYRAPTPLDLSYLVTAWATNAEQQQKLLAWAIRTIEESPSLPAAFLNRFASNGADVFGPMETVELVGEQISIQDAVAVWEVAKSKQQPSAYYLARLVLIDSEVVVSEFEPVQTRVLAPGVLSGSLAAR